jgi:hypothetical protein
MSTDLTTKEFKRGWFKRHFGIGISDRKADRRKQYQTKLKGMQKQLKVLLKDPRSKGGAWQLHLIKAQNHYRQDEFKEAIAELETVEKLLERSGLRPTSRDEKQELKNRLEASRDLARESGLLREGTFEADFREVAKLVNGDDFGKAAKAVEALESKVLAGLRDRYAVALGRNLGPDPRDERLKAQLEVWSSWKAAVQDSTTPVSDEEFEAVGKELKRQVELLASDKTDAMSLEERSARLAELLADLADWEKKARTAGKGALADELKDLPKQLTDVRRKIRKDAAEWLDQNLKDGEGADPAVREAIWKGWKAAFLGGTKKLSEQELALAKTMAEREQTLLDHPSSRPGPGVELTPAERKRRLEARRAALIENEKLLGAMISRYPEGVDEGAKGELTEAQEKVQEDIKFARVDQKDPYCSALFEKRLRKEMLKIKGKIGELDATPDGSLMERIATKLDKILHEMTSEAVQQYMEHQGSTKTDKNEGFSYSEAMDLLLSEEGGKDLFEHCPGLQKMIDLESKNFQRNVGEVLDQTKNDQKDLEKDLFGGNKMKGLKDFIIADSDPHNGGRRVTILKFEGQDDKEYKVVHKPRDCRVDGKFVGKTGKVGNESSLSERASQVIRERAEKKERARRIRESIQDKLTKPDLDDNALKALDNKKIEDLTGGLLKNLKSDVANDDDRLRNIKRVLSALPDDTTLKGLTDQEVSEWTGGKLKSISTETRTDKERVDFVRKKMQELGNSRDDFLKAGLDDDAIAKLTGGRLSKVTDEPDPTKRLEKIKEYLVLPAYTDERLEKLDDAFIAQITGGRVTNAKGTYPKNDERVEAIKDALEQANKERDEYLASLNDVQIAELTGNKLQQLKTDVGDNDERVKRIKAVLSVNPTGNPSEVNVGGKIIKVKDITDNEVKDLTGVPNVSTSKLTEDERVTRIKAVRQQMETERNAGYANLDDTVAKNLTGEDNFHQTVKDDVGKDFKDMPGFKYICKEDKDHHYGWVEFVEHGRKEDVILTKEKAKNFYKQSGRQAALALLFGIEDIHQGNIMVSNGEPQLTDLEIAFSSKVFDKVKECYDSEGPPDNNTTTATMIHQGLTYGTEPKQTGVQVKNDRILERDYDKKDEPTDNLVAMEDPTKPGEYLTQVDGLVGMFSKDLEDGFNEILEAFGDPDLKDEMDTFVDSFKGMHVRYHAKATGDQLKARRNQMWQGYTDKDQKSIDTTVEGWVKDNEKIAPLKEVIQEDLKERDVAYFTQELGTRHLLHNGKTEIKREDKKSYFDHGGLSQVKGQLSMLRDPRGMEFMKQVGSKMVQDMSRQSNHQGFSKEVHEELDKLI